MHLADKIALTIDDAVQVGPLPRSGIYQAISDGRLTARKDGRRTFIMRAEFERFLATAPVAEIRLGGSRSPLADDGSGPRPSAPALRPAA